MLAERLPTILPGLDAEAALEVTSIHSVAGTLPPGCPLLTGPPFCGPHHTATSHVWRLGLANLAPVGDRR